MRPSALDFRQNPKDHIVYLLHKVNKFLSKGGNIIQNSVVQQQGEHVMY